MKKSYWFLIVSLAVLVYVLFFVTVDVTTVTNDTKVIPYTVIENYTIQETVEVRKPFGHEVCNEVVHEYETSFEMRYEVVDVNGIEGLHTVCELTVINNEDVPGTFSFFIEMKKHDGNWFDAEEQSKFIEAHSKESFIWYDYIGSMLEYSVCQPRLKEPPKSTKCFVKPTDTFEIVQEVVEVVKQRNRTMFREEITPIYETEQIALINHLLS